MGWLDRFRRRLGGLGDIDQPIGMRGPIAVPRLRPPTWYGVNEPDLQATFDQVRGLFTRLPSMAAYSVAQDKYVTEILRPFDATTLCPVVVNGISASVPCDLDPGPRPPTEKELDEWWVAAAVDRFGNGSWAVVNGTIGFSTFYAPDGELYIKYFNSDSVAHRDRPPGKLLIKRSVNLFDYASGAITDVAGFISHNICLIASGAAATQGGPVAAAAAGAACRAITGGPAAPIAPPPGTPGGGLRFVTGPNGATYVVENGVRHLIPDPETFVALGWDWAKVERIDDGAMLTIPLGAQVPSRKPGVAPPPVLPPAGGLFPATAWYKANWVPWAALGLVVVVGGAVVVSRV